FASEHRGEVRALLASHGDHVPRRLVAPMVGTLQAGGSGRVATLRFWLPILIDSDVSDEGAVELLGAAVQLGEPLAALLALDRVVRPRAVTRPNQFFRLIYDADESADHKTVLEPRAAVGRSGGKEVVERAWRWLWDMGDGDHRERLIEIVAGALRRG